MKRKLSLGVISTQREMQVILAGYEGAVDRLEIGSDEQLAGFFESVSIMDTSSDTLDNDDFAKDPKKVALALFPDSPQGGKGEPRRKALVEYEKELISNTVPEVIGTKEEMQALRLGNLITKAQMAKFCRSCFLNKSTNEV